MHATRTENKTKHEKNEPILKWKENVNNNADNNNDYYYYNSN